MKQPYVPVSLLLPEYRALVGKYRVEVISDRLRGDAFSTGTLMLRFPERQSELPTWAEVVNDTIGWNLAEHAAGHKGVDFFFYNTR